MKTQKNILFREHLLFLGPASICFVLVVFLPFIMSVGYSMTDWNGVSNTIRFIGLQNFITVFSGKSDFLQSFLFTFKMTVASVVLTNLLGLAMAGILTTQIRLSNFFRAVFFLPNTMGGIVLGFIWQFIFIAGFPAIGQLLNLPFFEMQWLGTEGTAFASLLIVSVWQGVGYVMVLMVAGLVAVPHELLEAAQIDGASRLHTFFRIRLPICMPYITICLFWTISNAFKMFDLNVSLTKGGPYGSTTSLALDIYQDAFANNKYGLATAESLVFFLIIFGITSLQLFLSLRKEAQLG